MSGLEQVIGLQAAPDYANRARLSSWMARYAADMAGAAEDSVVGYDLGDHAHSFNGPVALVPDPTKAINATASGAGVYRPTAEFQNGASQNPDLDPYNRVLWARMNGIAP
jgi:hypothetical protein